MPSLMIRNLPMEIHRKLKEYAARHHRSMTRQAVAILESALRVVPPVPRFHPVRGAGPMTDEIIAEGKKRGRA